MNDRYQTYSGISLIFIKSMKIMKLLLFIQIKQLIYSYESSPVKVIQKEALTTI